MPGMQEHDGRERDPLFRVISQRRAPLRLVVMGLLLRTPAPVKETS